VGSLVRDDFNFRGMVFGAYLPWRTPWKGGVCTRFRIAQCFQSWEQNEALPLVTLSVGANCDSVGAWASVSYRFDTLGGAVAALASWGDRAWPARTSPPSHPAAHSTAGVDRAALSASSEASGSPAAGSPGAGRPLARGRVSRPLARRKRLQYAGFSVGVKYKPFLRELTLTRGVQVSYMPTLALLWERSGVGAAVGLGVAAARAVAAAWAGLALRRPSSPGPAPGQEAVSCEAAAPRPPTWADSLAAAWAWLCRKTVQVGSSGWYKDGAGFGGTLMVNVSPFYFRRERGRAPPLSRHQHEKQQRLAPGRLDPTPHEATSHTSVAVAVTASQVEVKVTDEAEAGKASTLVLATDEVLEQAAIST
jgi:hypothetical protein